MQSSSYFEYSVSGTNINAPELAMRLQEYGLNPIVEDENTLTLQVENPSAEQLRIISTVLPSTSQFSTLGMSPASRVGLGIPQSSSYGIGSVQPISSRFLSDGRPFTPRFMRKFNVTY